MSISSMGFGSSYHNLFIFSHGPVHIVNLLRFNCHKYSLYTCDKSTYFHFIVREKLIQVPLIVKAKVSLTTLHDAIFAKKCVWVKKNFSAYWPKFCFCRALSCAHCIKVAEHNDEWAAINIYRCFGNARYNRRCNSFGDCA